MTSIARWRPLLVAVCTWHLGACSTGGTKVDDALVGSSPSLALPGTQLKPVVSLHYVSTIDPDARSLATQLYDKHCYGRTSCSPAANQMDAIDQALMKTNFYALELYQYLERSLPGVDVVLQPLKLGTSGAKLAADSGSGRPAQTVIIDFFAYVDPELEVDDSPSGSTAGRMLTPIVEIHDGSTGAFEATNGVIAVDAGLLGLYEPDYDDGTIGVRSTLPRMLNSPLAGGTAPTLASRAREQRPATPGQVLALPHATYELAGESPELRADAVFALYSNIVVDALNRIDPERHDRSVLASYAARFDPPLSQRLRAGGPLTEEDAARLAVLTKFLEAEGKLLEDQDQAFLAQAYRGEWGQDFKRFRAAEVEQIEAARSNDIMMAVGMIGAVAGIGAGYAVGQPVDISPSTNIMQVAAAEKARMSATLDAEVEALRDGQGGRTIAILGEEIDLRVGSVDELRAKLEDIYARRFGDARSA